MIRRPVDIGKLLFLYFLKSSAAFASEPSKNLIPGEYQPYAPQQQQQQQRHPLKRIEEDSMGGHISLRIARRSDILSIQRCNLLSLPENYNEQFYANHMRQWPELALVVEHVPAGYTEETKAKGTTMRLLGSFANNSKVLPYSNNYSGKSSSRMNKDECQIVGYVLGKVDQIPRYTTPSFSQSYAQDDDNGFLPLEHTRPQITYENMGHVTSLAILDGYRRKGLAAHLMNQLHYEMRQFYNADAVGLHVRVSNDAATNLYGNGLGYKVHSVQPGYYQDGEDAYLMRKEFISEVNNSQQNYSLDNSNKYNDAPKKFKKFRFPTFHDAQYKSRKEMMLPRVIFDYGEQKPTFAGESQTMENEQGNVSPFKTAASVH